MYRHTYMEHPLNHFISCDPRAYSAGPAPEDRTVSDGMSGQLMASPIPDVPAVPGSETNANDDEIEI